MHTTQSAVVLDKSICLELYRLTRQRQKFASNRNLIVMSEYNVFGNLNFLCDGVDVAEAKELDWELADDSTDFNLSQEEISTKKPEKVNKKPNTRKKASTKTTEVKKPETPTVEVSTANRKKLPLRRARCLNKSTDEQAAVQAVLQATTEQTVQPTTRRTRGRKSLPAANNPPAVIPPTVTPPTRGRGRRRNQRASVRNQDPVAASNDVLFAIQAALNRCAAASAAGSGRSVVRSRRRFLAENAARSRPVDVIDLVSSPVVPVQGTITLDSDDDEVLLQAVEQPQVTQNLSKTTTTNTTKPKAADYDEENPELEVKVMWNDQIETHQLRKYQKFVHLMQKLSEAHDCTAEQIVCNLDDQIILKDDTPDKINLKSYHIIYARALSEDRNNTILLDEKKKAPHNANQICLKIQSDKRKKPLEVDMLKSDKFLVLYIKCAEELQLPRNSIKLEFDGYELRVEETPEMLDFEGGELIDMRVID